MAALVIDLSTESVASDEARLREALAYAARDAAEWRAETDEHQARALRFLAAMLRVARSDEHALQVLAAASQALRDEVAGATADTWVRAAITGGEGGADHG